MYVVVFLMYNPTGGPPNVFIFVFVMSLFFSYSCVGGGVMGHHTVPPLSPASSPPPLRSSAYLCCQRERNYERVLFAHFKDRKTNKQQKKKEERESNIIYIYIYILGPECTPQRVIVNHIGSPHPPSSAVPHALNPPYSWRQVKFKLFFYSSLGERAEVSLLHLQLLGLCTTPKTLILLLHLSFRRRPEYHINGSLCSLHVPRVIYIYIYICINAHVYGSLL
eukprot:gene9834-6907_t